MTLFTANAGGASVRTVYNRFPIAAKLTMRGADNNSNITFGSGELFHTERACHNGEVGSDLLHGEPSAGMLGLSWLRTQVLLANIG